MDVHAYIVHNSVDFGGYNLTTPAATLSGATNLIAHRNSHGACVDYPACLNLVSNGVVEFGSNASNDPFLNPAFANEQAAVEWLQAFAPPDFKNVKVVQSITIDGDSKEGISIADDPPIFTCAVLYSATPATWAHEFGHMCGLAEGDYVAGLCSYNIMKANLVAPSELRDQLEFSQVVAIENALAAEPDLASAATVDCDPLGISVMEGISGVASGSGVDISFATLWEAYTSSFEVQRVDLNSGATLYSLGTVGWQPDGVRKKYEVTDPSGSTGSIYRIIEHQEGGRGDLITSPVIAGASASNGGDGATYNADSLAEVVSGYDDGLRGDPRPDPCSNRFPPLNAPAEYEILCPDSFVTALINYASLWRNRGVDTQVIDQTMADSCAGGYAGWVHWAAARGTRCFLLAGDANDHVMRDDSTKWVNGWRYPRQWRYQNGQFIDGPHIPSQPDKDIIPTFYKAVTDSPQTAWTYYTPYYASDLPYADVDGDSLPDVVIGRLPASSVTDINAYTAKLATWLSSTGGSLGSNAALLSYAVNHGDCPAWPTASAIDLLRAAYPGSASVTQAAYTYFGDPTWGSMFRDSIEAIGNAAASGGADVITWNLNSSDRYEYTGFWRLPFANDQPPISNTTRPFISVALCCGMNDFDRTENSNWSGTWPGPFQYFNYVRPIVEKLLFHPSRGAVAQVGPTRASFTMANPLFGQEFLTRLYAPGASVGTAFLYAQRHCMQTYPQYREFFKSYVLLGDPRLGPNTITGVAQAGQLHGIRLSLPAPNPFNPLTRLRFYLDRPTRVSLTIFDVQGRSVRRLVPDGPRRAGWAEVIWDGKTDAGAPAGSGVYFARLSAGLRATTQRLVVLK